MSLSGGEAIGKDSINIYGLAEVTADVFAKALGDLRLRLLTGR